MRHKLSLVGAVLGAGCGLTLLLAGAGPTWADPTGGGQYTVNSTLDTADSTPGDGTCETSSGNSTCTLRAAIQESNAQAGADTITFAVTGTINLAAGLPTLTDSLTILGPGVSQMTIVAELGAYNTILDINGPSNAHYLISGLAFRAYDLHSGIGIGHGTLTLTDLRFEHARTAVAATSPSALGDVEVTIANTLFDSNSGPGGGAIYNLNAVVRVHDSTFQNNGSGFGGGAIYNSGTTFVRQSTFVNNSTGGGGLGGSGGALYNAANNQLTVVNSTFSGNSVVNNGNSSGGALANAGAMTLTSVTLTNNTAFTGVGGGIRVFTGSVTLLQNSIIANSPQGGDCYQQGATVTDGGYNLVEDNSCGFTGGADPMLAGLADNGGPTLTHALLAGSPAIDAGNPAGCTDPTGSALLVDQRGYVRSVDGNSDLTARCDIGAFEYLSELLNLPLKLFLPLLRR